MSSKLFKLICKEGKAGWCDIESAAKLLKCDEARVREMMRELGFKYKRLPKTKVQVIPGRHLVGLFVYHLFGVHHESN